MDAITLLMAALSTARITRLVTTDRITEGPRNAMLRRMPEGSLLAYLLVCDWCVSMYVAGAVGAVGAWAGLYSWWWVLPVTLVSSYAAGWLASKEGE